jgi:cytochrome c-type biogenesis protein CcmH
VRRLALAAFTALALAAPAHAVTPAEQLSDPKLEARARALSQELRCLVCQNQSIDDSNAPLAHDLRVILRERLAAGDTDAQAKAYLVTRYGDFVLLRPPFQPDTWALWLGPFAVLLVGGAGAVIYIRSRGRSFEAPLSAQEEAEAAALLTTEEKLP